MCKPIVCCEFMRQQLAYTCQQHTYPCPNVLVIKGEKKIYLRAPNATYRIRFCSDCGKKIRYSRAK